MNRNTLLLILTLMVAVLGGLAFYATSELKKKSCALSDAEHLTLRLRDSIRLLQKRIDSLNDELYDQMYFDLRYNDDALDYLDADFGRREDWPGYVRDKLMETNLPPGDNPLIPYAGMYGPAKIHHARVVNHKWIMATFTDGKAWGEMLIKYEPAGPDSIRFETAEAVLYH